MPKLHFDYHDFKTLDERTLLFILAKRNEDRVRLWTYDPKVISKSEHLNFCRGLFNKSSMLYFYLTLNKKPYGVISFKGSDNSLKSCETGYYTFGSHDFADDEKVPMDLAVDIAFYFMHCLFGTQKTTEIILRNNNRSLKSHFSGRRPNETCLEDDKYLKFTNEINHETALEVLKKRQSLFDLSYRIILPDLTWSGTMDGSLLKAGTELFRQ